MSFHDVLFPDDHSYNTRGGPGHNTKITLLDSGQEQRLPKWNGARRQFDIEYERREHTRLAQLQEFIIARQGATHSFRLRDWHDCTSHEDSVAPELDGTAPTVIDVLIGNGDETTVNFQLVKFYASGGVVRTRNITKPRAGTVLVALNGAEKVEGVDFTVNLTSGIVTFTTAPTATQQITAGFQFDVPVRFTEEADQLLSTPVTDFGSGEAINVSMIEDLADFAWPEERFFGGTNARDVGASFTLDTASELVQVLNVTAAGLNVSLPDTGGGILIPGGGPWFHLINEGTFSIDVQTFDGLTLVFVLAPGEFAIIVYDDENDAWYAGIC